MSYPDHSNHVASQRNQCTQVQPAPLHSCVARGISQRTALQAQCMCRWHPLQEAREARGSQCRHRGGHRREVPAVHGREARRHVRAVPDLQPASPRAVPDQVAAGGRCRQVRLLQRRPEPSRGVAREQGTPAAHTGVSRRRHDARGVNRSPVCISSTL